NNLNSKNNSVAYQFYNQLKLEELNISEYAMKRITKNQPLDSKVLNEILQVNQQSLRLNREKMKYDYYNLIKDNLKNKPLLFAQFYQFLEIYNRDQYHSIADHNKQVVMMLNDLVNSIYEQIKIANPEITLYPPQLKFFKNYLLK